eukprot:GHRR01026135.1.p1 GENE.GHRR01026135.1~~GHRR01026135.1.p1  ORF type:complete len:122 (+),score=22.92 GHRR01026135.1:399-764(+)
MGSESVLRPWVSSSPSNPMQQGMHTHQSANCSSIDTICTQVSRVCAVWKGVFLTVGVRVHAAEALIAYKVIQLSSCALQGICANICLYGGRLSRMPAVTVSLRRGIIRVQPGQLVWVLASS